MGFERLCESLLQKPFFESLWKEGEKEQIKSFRNEAAV